MGSAVEALSLTQTRRDQLKTVKGTLAFARRSLEEKGSRN
ncbi:hypothetical protein ABIB85_008463 [Bradyrhizobium sp. JR1.5]